MVDGAGTSRQVNLCAVAAMSDLDHAVSRAFTGTQNELPGRHGVGHRGKAH
jgi:hypothetical protein